MRIYEYLEERIGIEYEWEEYADGEAEIKEPVGEGLLCDVWEAITEWAADYSDDCSSEDALLLLKVLNETLAFIYEKTKMVKLTSCLDEPIAIKFSDVVSICSFYAHCCVFVNSSFGGNKLFEQCRLIANNKTANIWFSTEKPCVTLSDIEGVNPETDEWEPF